MSIPMYAPNAPEELSGADLSAFLADLVYRMAMHNLFWFDETAKHLSYEEALTIQQAVHQRLNPLIRKRLYAFFQSTGQTEIPALWSSLTRDGQLTLAGELSKNWLAQDGIWFQAIEFSHDMKTAKAANDAAWAKFSPLEAISIKHLLHMEENPGLPGLARALAFRLYARLNRQRTYFKDGALYLEMNHCRVQAARNRKHMEDYPCKSAGVVEYSTFASTLDPRITTTCVACPPDKHPAEWHCCWKFSMGQ